MSDKETLARWMMQHGYATGHGDTMEDLLAELDIQIVENWNRALINGVKTEREACAKVCDAYDVAEDVNSSDTAEGISIAIRARGQG